MYYISVASHGKKSRILDQQSVPVGAGTCNRVVPLRIYIQVHRYAYTCMLTKTDVNIHKPMSISVRIQVKHKHR